MRDKREIFKKETLPLDEQDVDSLDEVDKNAKSKKTHSSKQDRHAQSKLSRKSLRRHSDKHHLCEAHVKDSYSPKTRGHLKHKRRRDKERAIRDAKISTQAEDTNERKSFITKNRLTRYIGIYNKGKKSETIYREQRKSSFFNKVSARLKDKTKKDMSKVLDCSSFQIRSLHTTSMDITTCMDHLNYQQDINSGSSSYQSDHKDQLADNIERKEVDSSPASLASISTSRNLPLKTPLNNITQKLINSLEPSETFGRDCLQELRNELKTYYRKSSSTLGCCESGLPQSTPANPTVTPVRIGSKAESRRKLFMSSISKIELLSRQNMETKLHRDQKSENEETLMEAEKITEQNENISCTRSRGMQECITKYNHLTDNTEFCFKSNQPDFLSQPFSTAEELMSTQTVDHQPSSDCSFDILSILDQDLRCTDEVSLFDLRSPFYSNVSPLKKPSLEIASPPGKLFPRKLF